VKKRLALKSAEVVWALVGIAGLAYVALCEYAFHSPKVTIIAEEGREFRFNLYSIKEQRLLLEVIFHNDRINSFFHNTEFDGDPSASKNRATDDLEFSLQIEGQTIIHFSNHWGEDFSFRHLKAQPQPAGTPPTRLKAGRNKITIKIEKANAPLTGAEGAIYFSSHNGLKKDTDPIYGVGLFGEAAIFILSPFYLFAGIVLALKRREAD